MKYDEILAKLTSSSHKISRDGWDNLKYVYLHDGVLYLKVTYNTIIVFKPSAEDKAAIDWKDWR